MRIARHHQQGTQEHRISEALHPAPDYRPTCEWPEDCTVQWGHGLVPAVPFFEAFPKGTFIRGEGTDIAEAERNAFDQYLRHVACDHVWGRQRPGGELYTNGAAFCRKCGGFLARKFPPLRPSGWWRKPLSSMEVWHLRSSEGNAELNEIMDRKYPETRESRRLTARQLRLRYNVFGMSGDEEGGE